MSAPPKEVKNPKSADQAVSYLPLVTKNVKSETSAIAETDINKHTSETENQPTRENTVEKNSPQVEVKIMQSPIEQIKTDENEYFGDYFYTPIYFYFILILT